MICYASRTGTRRNLAVMRAAGWRLLVVASTRGRSEMRTEGFRYAIDNGAWPAYQRGKTFPREAFERVVDELGAGADWIVAPDIVAGGRASLDLSLSWLDRLVPIAPVLLAVQDGMQTDDVRPILGRRVGLFVGGSTDWKLSTLASWGALGRSVGCYVHVARVNSVRRIWRCQDAGAHSIDGTSVTRWAVNIRRLDGAARQGGFSW